MTPAEPASAPSSLGPLADQLRLAVPAYLAASRALPVSTPNRTCAATSSGAPSATSIPWPPSDSTWRCTSGGCRRPAGSSPSTVSRRFSVTAGFYSTCAIDGVLEHWITRRARPPSSSACRIADSGLHPPAVRGPARRRPPVTAPLRLALVALLGLLGLRIFEATSADI